MAQVLENIMDMLLALQQSMDAIANIVATHGDALAELRCSSGTSATQPSLVTHPIPPSPAQEFPESNLPKDLRIPAQSSGRPFIPPQSMGGLFSLEMTEFDSTMVKLA